MTPPAGDWHDPALRRIERGALVCCGAFALVALAVPGGGAGAAAGVLGGGLLAGASYWAIRRAVDGLVGTVHPDRRRGPVLAVAVALLLGRYALLAFLAYVMIARLRLHPVGLLAGASSIFVAVLVEAVRGMAGSGRHRRR